MQVMPDIGSVWRSLVYFVIRGLGWSISMILYLYILEIRYKNMHGSLMPILLIQYIIELYPNVLISNSRIYFSCRLFSGKQTETCYHRIATVRHHKLH